VTGILIALVAVEFLTIPPRQAWSYSQAPPVYAWMARQSKVRVIAEYPLTSPTDAPNGDYFSYQPIHGKRMVNVRYTLSPQLEARAGIFGLGDPQTVPVLRALGVDEVIAHPGLVGAEPSILPSADLELVRSFPGAGLQGANVYRIRPGRKATAVVGIRDGFHTAESDGWKSERWVRSEGTLVLDAVGRGARLATVSFQLSSAFQHRRSVTISQGGRVLWRESLADRPADVSFVARVGEPIVIRATPGAKTIAAEVPGSTDTRDVALRIARLETEPSP
jgi:hypothetical protein